MRLAKSRSALTVLLLGAAAIATVAACGDDGGGNGDSASPTAATSPAAKSGPGTITITSSTPITGQSKKVLLVYAAPQAGGALLAEACIQLTSDRVSVPSTVMTEKKGDQAPCSGSAGPAKLPEGTYSFTAGIYAPPAQTAEKEVKLTIEVKGDVTAQIDGAALSK